MSLTFEQAAERIKQLDQAEGTTAFEMGDLALDQYPVGLEGPEDAATLTSATNAEALGERGSLAALAQASGVSFDVLRERRLVATRVPPVRRLAGVAWSVYLEIARIEDEATRERLLGMLQSEPPTNLDAHTGECRPTRSGRWTVDAVRSHRGAAPTRYAPGQAPITSQQLLDAVREQPQVLKNVMASVSPAERLEAIGSMLHDEDVRAEMQARPFLRADIERTLDQSSSEYAARRKAAAEAVRSAQQAATSPSGTTVERSLVLARVANQAETWARELDDIVEFLATCSDVQDVRRWSAHRALEGLRDAVGRCLTALPAPQVEADDLSDHREASSKFDEALASAR